MTLEPLDYRPAITPWLRVIHEDRDMVVVNKPGGLLSVPGRTPDLFDSVLSRVRETHPHAQAVHRLDLGTSGVLVVATRRKAEAILRQQFQDRLTRKVYLARVQGRVGDDAGRIDLPLICDWPNRPRQMVCHHTGKPALTDYVVLERATQSTLVLLRPQTGRSHQLRVHMASLDTPFSATTSTATHDRATHCSSTPASWASITPTVRNGPCFTPPAILPRTLLPLRLIPFKPWHPETIPALHPCIPVRARHPR